MKRPTVLHCAERWLRPSEGFVLDLVRSTTATRAAVVCRTEEPGMPPSPFRVRRVDPPVLRSSLLSEWRLLTGGLTATAVRERADVLHCHFGYWAEPVSAVARRLHLPWVLSLHGEDLLAYPDRTPTAVEAFRQADVVVVPSQWLAERAVARGVDPDRVRVIPAGVDLSQLPWRARTPSPDGRVTVTFAGRYVEKKGVLDAVAALALASEQVPGLHAVFVGYGELEPGVRSALADAGLSHELRDGREAGAVRQALAETDLVLTASKVARDGDAESLGLVNVEALAVGAPLVATRSGGIPEHVPDGDVSDAAAPALLADEGDVAGLASRLVDLARAPETWADRGRAGRAHVAQHLELGARTGDVEQVYLALAEGRPVPAPAPERPQRPTVSVVMVTHDRRPLLAQALDALEAQTLPDVEVVVVDNGCSDGSSEDLAERAGPRLKVLRSETNSPPAQARNRAAAVASGEVIAFTDDDCRPVPTWAECLVAGMREGIGIVQGRTTADPRLPLEPLSRTQWTPAEYGLYETANVAYDAECFRAVGGFDEQLAAQVADVLGPRLGRYPFGEDTDLAWRVRRAGAETRFAPHALVEHHVFPPDRRLLLRRSVLAAGFPLLAREVPELRRVFLTGGFLLGRHRVWHLLALGALPTALVTPWALVLGAPYAWRLVQPRRRGRKARIKALPVLVLRDLAETGALVVGSVRARCVVI
ncbi:MAG TPA: glycosyltransferase [Mycobacteriales bacterium]|nr:glycosyltransferase [Mycobacteriales bacterium]